MQLVLPVTTVIEPTWLMYEIVLLKLIHFSIYNVDKIEVASIYYLFTHYSILFHYLTCLTLAPYCQLFHFTSHLMCITHFESNSVPLPPWLAILS